MKYDYLIVGAGFAGCVLAERLATQLGKKILLIDKRSHIAGNAADGTDEHGVRIHYYGPHLFHTNDENIRKYLSQFTLWHSYEHRVLASVNGMLVPMPVNRTTVNALFGIGSQPTKKFTHFMKRKKNRSSISGIRKMWLYRKLAGDLTIDCTEDIQKNIGVSSRLICHLLYAVGYLFGQIQMTDILMTGTRRCLKMVTPICSKK